MRNNLPNPNDLLIAIRKKCLDCMGGQAKVVKSCTSKDCTLHPYRCIDALNDGQRDDEQIEGQLSMLTFQDDTTDRR